MIFTLRHLTAIALISALAGCTSDQPAPIVAIGDSAPRVNAPASTQNAVGQNGVTVSPPETNALPQIQPLSAQPSSAQQPATQPSSVQQQPAQPLSAQQQSAQQQSTQQQPAPQPLAASPVSASGQDSPAPSSVKQQPQPVVQAAGNIAPAASTATQNAANNSAANSANTAASSQAAADAASASDVQVRDGHIVYNRQYDNIAKGSYAGGSSYTVRHGDTLFYIAWITGNDYRDLAKRNNIAEPYNLKPGEVLQVETASGASLTGENALSRADANASINANTSIHAQPGTAKATEKAPAKTAEKTAAAVAPGATITYSANSGKQNDKKMLPDKRKTPSSPATGSGATSTASASSAGSASSAASTASVANLSWRWPTKGKIVDGFSAGNIGNKGIDIAGSKGQPVLAAASGRVVYAGNALRGYGNLIIIKHNDDYLSAYAHNNTMLVREQQEVKAGQQIATMGSTGSTSTRLHFEIRYKGKPVNPLRYLPQR